MGAYRLEFLTEEKGLQEICKKYWASRDGRFLYKVSDIAEMLGTSISKVALEIGALCVVYNPDDSCPNCAAQKPITSRTALMSAGRYYRSNPSPCADCIRAESFAAERERQTIAEKKRFLLTEEVRRKSDPRLSASALGLRASIFLIALLRARGRDHDLGTVEALEADCGIALCARSEAEWKVIDYLYQAGLICIDPDSDMDAIQTEKDAIKECDISKVGWVLATREGGPSADAIFKTIDERLRSSCWPRDWCAEAVALFSEIAIDECLQFLKIELEKYGLQSRPGEKVLTVLRTGLAQFSLGQMFNFIWRAARDAAAFSRQSGISSAHAVNTVPGAIERSIEKAKTQGWSTKPLARNSPESMLSHVFFTATLDLPDDGLKTVPPSDPSFFESRQGQAAGVA